MCAFVIVLVLCLYAQLLTDVLLGFLAYQFPTHVCLISTEEGSIESTYSIGDLLLELAACVHEIVSLFPHELVKEMESVELQWEPLGRLLHTCMSVYIIALYETVHYQLKKYL